MDPEAEIPAEKQNAQAATDPTLSESPEKGYLFSVSLPDEPIQVKEKSKAIAPSKDVPTDHQPTKPTTKPTTKKHPVAGEKTDRDHDDEARQDLTAAFSTWLDAALEKDDPPSGLPDGLLEEQEPQLDPSDPARSCGLYDMWATLTALVQETKLQGRSFKQMGERFEPLSGLDESIEAGVAAHQDAVQQLAVNLDADASERAVKMEAQAVERGRSESLNLLLDLRDRIKRGLDVTRQMLEKQSENRPRMGFWARLFGAVECPDQAELCAPLIKGVTLSFERLEDALRAMGVESIVAKGKPFDPEQMRAVDLVQTADAPDGTVLEVYRDGYLRHGAVIRHAEVKVARTKIGN